MKSPFIDLPIPESEAYNEINGMYDEIKFKSPFLDSGETEAATNGEEMKWQGEDLVDEEENELDLHEGEVDLEEEDTASVEPLRVPENNPVPFAPVPPPGSFWPIITAHSKGREVAFQGADKKYRGTLGRRFLASRTDGGRYHCGCDLWANDKDPIVACEDGTIVNFYHFYRSTYALLVEHSNIVVNYGEVHKDSLTANNLKVGDKVKAGQVIALVGKMYSSSMLHFETYIKGTRSNKRFPVGGTAPKELLNPTRYLLFLQNQGLQGKSASRPAVVSGTRAPSAKNWAKAIEQNRYYGSKVPWIQHQYAINDLLLKAIGKSNVSLGEEAFAEAVAAWQLQNGFSQKDADGIIGPNTWKKMQAALGMKANIPSQPSISSGSPDKSIVSKILQYTGVIEKYSSLYKINPNIVRGIIAAESGGNTLSGKGKSGYKGLMQAERTEDQLQPEVSVKTGIDKFIKFRDKTLNPWLAQQGISQPAENDESYLKACLACYNAGPVTA
jgi:murein DD-endopeptidase MepM/ murein hydrolase activator NlpD